MQPGFVTNYNEIVNRIDTIDPEKYGKTRNFTDGAVTYLSPYLSRGVISTRQVLDRILRRGYKASAIQSLVRELCWRDYFQRVAQSIDINTDIKATQHPVVNHAIPSHVINANTGIDAIDNAITNLYSTGYMHNHCRMYTASLVCNIAKSHWLMPAKWMYYYLLDGDWASNACNWQWIAGTNSSKKYYANQENINRYSSTNQQGTYLDTTYELLDTIPIPSQLSGVGPFALSTKLPSTVKLSIDSNHPTFLYNYHNLDPNWRANQTANRILLLEPAFFDEFPVSQQCINFVLGLGENIPGLQVYTGSFASLVNQYDCTDIYYKEHPLNRGYTGIVDERDWIVEEVDGYYPSFSAYWKKLSKHLLK